jgi:hypothetical protein
MSPGMAARVYYGLHVPPLLVQPPSVGFLGAATMYVCMYVYVPNLMQYTYLTLVGTTFSNKTPY